MAWFKFGKQDSAPEAPLETVEMMRTRAKRRLIGSLVLVVTAVVGFPLLFETQPRPALVDVPIEIPDKAKARPLTAPAPSAPAAAAKVEDKSSLGGKEEIVSETPAAPASAVASALPAIAAPKSVEKPAVIATPAAPIATKPITPPPNTAPDSAASDKAAAQKAAQDKAKAEAAEKSKSEAAKAQALLDGKANTASAPVQAAAANATGERFIVQFGSFADEGKAREVRQRVERAGLKTYAQTADTAEGKRHRVRVGPFASRAEAEKAATKIKSLDLPANILTL